MDIEWAKDGLTEELYVVQARPETVQSRKSQQILSSYVLKGTGNILLSGRAVGQMIGNGKARIITDLNKLNSFQEGEVIVAKQTDPDWEPIMKKASAIITDQGGRTCHAAIVARELGIPAVVGCISATKMIHNGQEVTVSCAEGEQGNVYQGIIPYQVEKTELENLPHTKTQILLNVSNPENVFTLSTLPSNGVGLVRLEFIINNHIGIHPLALLHGEKISNLNVKSQIEKLTNNYATPALFFIEHLVSGIAMIAAAFYPQPVIVRMSDFKSNEYANLLGGTDFEPLEENPMLGWRGASRYYDPKYELAYSLECISIKKVRDELGLDNVIPMIPFCRTPAEGRKVIAKMNQYGLTQRENGLQVYMMCEIPSNIILAKEFSEIFDGFSIGSNDLTQLILGLDRDSALVGHLFDERNDAVKGMISQFIQTIHKTGKKVGICGQAPSDYPEFAEFLVKEGIDSISLNPDSFLKTLLAIDLIEKNPSCCSQLGS
jgi:pyruvate,water dikinase